MAAVMTFTPLAAQADWIDDRLQQQQDQLDSLYRQQQIQANQQEIERLQRSISGPQQPSVVETLLGAAIVGGALWLNSPYAEADAWDRYDSCRHYNRYYC